MHLKRGDAYEEPRSTKLFLLAVVTQDVADVLAKEALDALTKFLYAVDVRLVHLPLGVRARLKRRNLLIDSEVPGDVGDQVFDHGKGFHGKDGYGLIERERVHARFA